MSSVFRPGSKFYNEEQLLKAIPEAPNCIVIVAVAVTRMTYKNTLKHLELSLSEPCLVIVSEDTAYWQRSDPLVLDYVNRNSKWFYAKHASPLFGIMAKFSQWLQSFSRPLLDRVPVLKEIVIVPSVNSYSIHFYDLFHFCFDKLNLPWDSMIMVLEDDIMIRHDAVQFSRWVSSHLLAYSRNYWALSLDHLDLGGQAVYRAGEIVRDTDNYDVFVDHNSWSTWGYALTRMQWETWWHKGFSWWICFDSTLRKSMHYYHVPTIVSGLVRSQHTSSVGVHTSIVGCEPWGEVDLHVKPLVLNYTNLGFGPRIRDPERSLSSIERNNCDT